MTASRKMPSRRGGGLYFVATLVAQFCALTRYTILARVLGPEQLGLAATLILISNFFEQISDSGSDRFLVQNKTGDAPEALRLLHYIAVSRGALIALALIILAQPLAGFYNAPALALALPLLGSAPFLFGFRHLDYRRLQRHNDFRPESWIMILGETSGLIGTAIATFVLRDFTAIIVGLALRAWVMVTVSHLLARRKYRIGSSHEHGAQLRRFALPLMANGLLMFAGMQGDRVLIGRLVGLAELGQYSAALLMIYYPLAVLQKLVASTHFPLIAAAQGNPARFERAANALAGKSMLFGVAALWGYALVGSWACTMLYGHKFAQPVWLIGLIGIFQFVRFSRVWPTNLALGTGRSDVVLINNLVRLVAIPLAIAGTFYWKHLAAVIVAFAIGEALALVVSVVMIDKADGRSMLPDLKRMGVLALSCVVVLGFDLAWSERSATLALLSLIALSGCVLLVWRSEREVIVTWLGKFILLFTRAAGRSRSVT